jgi:hypothetical protein
MLRFFSVAVGMKTYGSDGTISLWYGKEAVSVDFTQFTFFGSHYGTHWKESWEWIHKDKTIVLTKELPQSIFLGTNTPRCQKNANRWPKLHFNELEVRLNEATSQRLREN